MLTHRATRRWPTTRAHAISVIAAVALMATVVFVPGAGAAAEQKTYTAVVSPDVRAGQTIPFTLTIVNTTKTQQIGSANLSAPSSFSLISALSPIPGGGTATIVGSTGGTVQLRSLAIPAGGTRTATFTAEVPCANGDYTWSIIAKQSNNFSGPPGNNFIPPPASGLVTNVSGQCSLEWVAQPQNARTGDRITNTQYDDFLGTPGPDFIEVEVRSAPYLSGPPDPTLVSFATDQVTLDFGNDASGGTANLGGTVSVNADGGVATFDPGPTIDFKGVNYTLLAELASNYLTPVTEESASFDISDAVCHVEQGTCTTPLTGAGGTRARATIQDSTVDGGFVAVSVGVLIDAAYCAGYTPPPGEQAVSILPSGVAGDPTLIVEATLDKSIVDAGTVPWSQLKVCWAQTSPFTGLNGPAPEVTIAGELQRQDLLLGCDPSGNDLVPPCQLPSIRNNRTGAVTLRVFASGTDPYKR